jgi:hypothetical protein
MRDCLDSVQHFVDKEVAMRDHDEEIDLGEIPDVELVSRVSHPPFDGLSFDVGIIVFHPRKEDLLGVQLGNRGDVNLSHCGAIKTGDFIIKR